jgi:hypothetical protein
MNSYDISKTSRWCCSDILLTISKVFRSKYKSYSVQATYNNRATVPQSTCCGSASTIVIAASIEASTLIFRDYDCIYYYTECIIYWFESIIEAAC